jgi:hypothetical protein
MELGENNMGSNDGANSKASLAARQRLRWTDELHEQFVEAVTQLGGPDSMYPQYNFSFISSVKWCYFFFLYNQFDISFCM